MMPRQLVAFGFHERSNSDAEKQSAKKEHGCCDWNEQIAPEFK